MGERAAEIFAAEGVIDFLAAQRRAERQESAGQSLRQAHHVGRNPRRLRSEHLAGSPKPRHHLVANQ